MSEFCTRPAFNSICTNPIKPLLKSTIEMQLFDNKPVHIYLYIKITDNDGTDAAPRSRAFALGVCGELPRSALLSTVFLNIITSRTEIPFSTD
jgi:hypothetical protein